MGNPILFLLLAFIAVVSALGMLQSRNAIHAALFLVLNFTTIAVLFLVLNAPFLFVTQITIYAGAIMVLFLFVVMLLGAEQLPGPGGRRWGRQEILAGALGVLLLFAFGYMLFLGGDAPAANVAAPVPAGPAEIGLTLFESYVFPFEVASILLLVSMIGVVVLRTKRGKNA
ncbi:MAG: NADH-quinone oxidoreductase subunit J [Chloroflexi bacterium]|nr:NADH-quinone oxidoreductase subunit J [Chloroflexota bacterium]MCI0579182.1 NADH-quinone oxidoreductase subunit J [Chloroflexota bacterium]MCI0645261.1 NADH-quinone oxidoreductase subunit J [Chloroflexota bacterium]MCI0726765.1 NADH-quinone oxidoreductase subunit J [Chloroflexota bacterium]